MTDHDRRVQRGRVEAALRVGAAELVTEDLQNGRRFGELMVRNPFPAQ